eukprot:TRINITY_DN2282_c0_g1_i2.p4 TRINITY_DN2282_c0_g1~~TRINITY_DN2282_c0_g1_i2.p4  ORF type:complete len:129 (+),score=35.34 TRINITY_DN2282_c0_g1_i2:48-434(+)
MARLVLGLCFVVALLAAGAAASEDTSSFQQLQCQDSGCSLCDLWTFPANTCLKASDGVWGMGSCTIFGFRQRVWMGSECVGLPTTDTVMPLNKCLKSSTNGYLEEICENAGRIGNDGGVFTLTYNTTA